MIGQLLQTIFLPKRTRDKLARQPTPARRGGQPQAAAGRDQQLNAARTGYRAQRATYQSLDEETRRQIEEDAAKAFGEALAQRKP